MRLIRWKAVKSGRGEVNGAASGGLVGEGGEREPLGKNGTTRIGSVGGWERNHGVAWPWGGAARWPARDLHQRSMCPKPPHR